MRASLDDQGGRDALVTLARCAGLRLPAKPWLAPWLVAVDLGDDRLQLRSAVSAYTVTHPLLVRIFRELKPLLDGRHTVDEIVSALDPDVLRTTALFLMQLLQGHGLLLAGPDDSALPAEDREAWAGQIAFLSHFVPDPAGAQRVLTDARVAVVGAPDLRNLFSDALRSVGVRHPIDLTDVSTWPSEAASGDPSLDLLIACSETPAGAFFEAVNAACLRTGTRWLRVELCGASAHLGPTVVPHQTPCYTCLDLRRQTHESDLDGYRAFHAETTSRRAHGRALPFISLTVGQTVLEVMRLLTGFAPALTLGRFYELNAAVASSAGHDVLKVPRCPSCGRHRSHPEVWDRGFALIEVEP